MFKKKQTNANGRNVIIDNEVVSVDTLRRKAKRANLLFWVAVCLVTMISGLILPYMSMASVSISDSAAFNGTIIPGYSNGGITVGAYAVDINSWGSVTSETVVGSTYGIWSDNRLDVMRNVSLDSVDGQSSDSISNKDKAAVWKQMTGRNSFSTSNPNGTTSATSSSQYDAVMPYRNAEEVQYFEKNNLSSSTASQDITVSLYPDFVIFAYDGSHAHVLNNPDDLNASTNGSVLNYSGTTANNTTAVPVYVPLNELFNKFGLNDVQTQDGEMTSIDALMKAISDDVQTGTSKDKNGNDINIKFSPKLDDLVTDTSKNLLANTSYDDVNNNTGGTSEAFNPFPYSMVFQKNSNTDGTSTPQVVTSSIYNNSEAYVYFSPNSMYNAYIALKEEANQIASQASAEIASSDPVTSFQLGYYYAAMMICEAYLTEALPQDMTRGYVGASEDTAPTVKGDLACDGNNPANLSSSGLDISSTDPTSFKSVTYATLMYDVAHQIITSSSGGTTGSEYVLGETNAIMNSLSVFGYDNKESYTPGVMQGMSAAQTFYRLTNFTPYGQNGVVEYPDINPFSSISPADNDSIEETFTSGMYVAPYYPIQQHLMPDDEKGYRFSILSVAPYNVVLELIAKYGLEATTKLTYASGDTSSFESVSKYMTKAKSLADQYQSGDDSDSDTSPLDSYTANVVSGENGRETLNLATSDQNENFKDANSRETQQRVDSALLAYASSTMISDNVHDLCDVIRAVPGLKYETFMRFYNPLKSDGGDTDVFLTRVSPAMTDYFPQILNRGYENAGGTEVSETYKTSGVSFDYFSVPSFAACFASHTGSTTYYGSLNYELRAFYKAPFLRTLSSNSNVPVPSLEDFQAAQDSLEQLQDEQTTQAEVTKANIVSLYVLSKRIVYSKAVQQVQAAHEGTTSINISAFQEQPDSILYEQDDKKWIKQLDTKAGDKVGDNTVSEIDNSGEPVADDTEDQTSDQVKQLADYIDANIGKNWYYAIYGSEAESAGVTPNEDTGDKVQNFVIDVNSILNDNKAKDAILKGLNEGLASQVQFSSLTISQMNSGINYQSSGIKTSEKLAEKLISVYNEHKNDDDINPDDEESGGVIYTSDSKTLTKILKGKTDELGGQASQLAKSVADGSTKAFTTRIDVVIEPGNWATDSRTTMQTATDSDSYGAQNYAIWSDNGSRQYSYAKINGISVNFDIDIQLVYNMLYDTYFHQYLDAGGDYYWDEWSDIVAYGKKPIGLEDANYDPGEVNTKHTVAFPIGLSLDIIADMHKCIDEFEEQAADLSKEIFKDVVGLAKDMELITSSMPSQMQNVLAWADYQNSSDSENQYQTDPSEANVTVNVSQSVETESSGNDTIMGQKDLEKYGVSWNPEGNGGEGCLEGIDTGSTSNAINEGQSRMARGVAGATWTSTVQPACYTMTAIAGRQERMSVDSDQNYPYAGIVDGRLQSGMDQYALLQAHVIDYSSIASGIAGDLATRERGQLIKVTDPEVGVFADIKNILNNIAGIFKELGLSMIRFTGELFDTMMFSDKSATKTSVKNTENADATAASLFNFSSVVNDRNYTTQTASCTTNYVNMNRAPATTSKFNTASGELVSASNPISSASAATTAIEEMGSSGLLKTGYPLYSFIQSLSLALVMVFLLVIAFQNFFAYSTGRRTDFIRAQTNLKVVLPRAIIAIIMIGLPPLSDSSVGFQGGCYLLLQFISGIISQISQVFVTLSGGGVIDSWIQVFESIEVSDIASILVWLICSLVVSAMFLLGCVVLLLQSIFLIVFWAIGPLVWSLYVWPYANNPNEQNSQHRMPTGGVMRTITQKLGLGAFTRGAVGNAAPSGWVYMYTNTAAMTIMWSILFWLVSVAISTTSLDGAGATATSTASTFGYAPTAGAVSLLNISDLGLHPAIQMLLLTVICVLLFWLMIKMTMSLFKNNAFNMMGIIPAIAKAIPSMGGGIMSAAGAAKDGVGAAKDGLEHIGTGITSAARKGVETAKNLANKDSDELARDFGRTLGKGIDAITGKDGKGGLAKRVTKRVSDTAKAGAKAGGRALDMANTAKNALGSSVAAQYAGNILQNNLADDQRITAADAAGVLNRRVLQRGISANEAEMDANNELISEIRHVNDLRKNKSAEELNNYLDSLSTRNPEMYQRLSAAGVLRGYDENGNYRLADEERMMLRVRELTNRNNALDALNAQSREADAKVQTKMSNRNEGKRADGVIDSMVAAGTIGSAVKGRKQELDRRERMINPEPVEQFAIPDAAAVRVDTALDSAIGGFNAAISSGTVTLDSTSATAGELARAISGNINAVVNSTQGYEAAIRDTYMTRAAAEGCNILSRAEVEALTAKAQSGGTLSAQEHMSLMLTESMIDAMGGTNAIQAVPVNYMGELAHTDVKYTDVSADVAKNVTGSKSRAMRINALYDHISGAIDSVLMSENVLKVPAVSDTATGTALMAALTAARRAGSTQQLFAALEDMRYDSRYSPSEIAQFEQEVKKQYDECFSDKSFLLANVDGISESDVDTFMTTDMKTENQKAAEAQRTYESARNLYRIDGGDTLTADNVKALQSAYDRSNGDAKQMRKLVLDDVTRVMNLISSLDNDVNSNADAKAMYNDLLTNSTEARKAILKRIEGAKGEDKNRLRTAYTMANNLISQSKALANANAVAEFINSVVSDRQLTSAIAKAPVNVTKVEKILIRERNDEIVRNERDMVARGSAEIGEQEHAVAQLDAVGANPSRKRRQSSGTANAGTTKQPRPQTHSGEVPQNRRFNSASGNGTSSGNNGSNGRRRRRS